MKLFMLASVIFAIFLISSCTNAENPAPPSNTPTPAAKATATPDEFASARVNFAKHCVACHGAEGEGGVKTVDDKKLKVPSLSTGHALKHTDEDFVEQIMKGGDGMPEFKDKLSPEEINLLVRFVRHEFQGKS
jgi:cytochrome c551